MINTLRRIVQRVSQAETVEQSMTDLVNMTRAAMNTDCCSLYFLDEDGLLLIASHGLAADAVGQARLRLGEGIVGTVALREELINLADAPTHPAFKRVPEAQEDAFRAFLAAPLIQRGRLVGVLVVQQKIARQFSEEEESFLITLASQLAPQVHQRALAAQKNSQRQCFVGLSASSGIGLGTAFVVVPACSLTRPAQRSDTPEQEWPRLQQALAATAAELELLSAGANGLSMDLRLVFDSYQMLLADPELQHNFALQCQQGWSAETAVCQVLQDAMGQFSQMSNDYLRERGADLQDLGQRLLAQLQGDSRAPTPETPFILVAEELTATMLLQYGGSLLQGVVSMRGGVNSHAAIIARAMSVPAIVAIDGINITQLQQRQLLLDAQKGQLWLDPTHNQQALYQGVKARREQLLKTMHTQLAEPCISVDGQSVALQLNADAASVSHVMGLAGIAGVGLYRTEALFMAADRFPSEQQQRRHYQYMLEQAAGKPVVIRTLDVGGDKPLPYMPIEETNPFLGWRGIRLCLDHPELFLGQLRAMLHANADCDNLKILVPMVSRIDEIHQCQRLLHQALAELVEELDRPLPIPQLGIMVEVPAALLQLPRWLKQVDFVSVGSNDLCQYLLAVDRNNERIGQQYDSYHPAMVLALAQIAQECRNTPFSLCGELAGEINGALMLLALGYRDLSMNSPSLGPIHYLVRKLDFSTLEPLKQALLAARDSQQVRELLQEYLQQAELDNLSVL